MNQAKTIIVGVTGGIAAYKSCELVRQLKKQGHHVTVVMTRSATQFVHPNTFQALSNEPVYIEMATENTQPMAHINLTRKADAFIIAPASANTIAKIANGICDNLLTSLVAARTCPLAIAPAMNTQMWLNVANQRNLKQLQEDGVAIFGPDQGELACGETGAGRMLEAQKLADLLPSLWTEKTLSGKKVVLTTGATYEAIDPVRGITNISSGKMGIALAKACQYAGAEVSLVMGQISQNILPFGMKRTEVQSADEMLDTVTKEVKDADIFISVAAISDYKVQNKSAQKIKKTSGTSNITLELTQNSDILAFVAGLPNPPFCVGFAAESENLLTYAENKRVKKNIPMIVANLVQNAMGLDCNQITILDKKGPTEFPLMTKNETATAIVQHLTKLLTESSLCK